MYPSVARTTEQHEVARVTAQFGVCRERTDVMNVVAVIALFAASCTALAARIIATPYEQYSVLPLLLVVERLTVRGGAALPVHACRPLTSVHRILWAEQLSVRVRVAHLLGVAPRDPMPLEPVANCLRLKPEVGSDRSRRPTTIYILSAQPLGILVHPSGVWPVVPSSGAGVQPVLLQPRPCRFGVYFSQASQLVGGEPECVVVVIEPLTISM